MTFLPRCGECSACATDGLAPCIPGSAANNAGHLIGDAQRLHRDGADVFHHLGVSGFADHAVVHETSVVPVDDDVPAEVAARPRVRGPHRRRRGHQRRPADARPDGRRRRAGRRRHGRRAHRARPGRRTRRRHRHLPRSSRPPAASEPTTPLTPDEAVEQGLKAEVVIECVGHARAFEAAIDLTAPGGRTITVGLPAPDATATISPLALVAQGRTIIGSYLGSAVPSRDIPVFADLWRAGRLPVEHLVSSHIALEDINDGMDELAEGRAIRQVITFG